MATASKELKGFGSNVAKNSTLLSSLNKSASGISGLTALGPAGLAAGILGRGLDVAAAAATATTVALAGLAAVQAHYIDKTGDEAEGVGITTDSMLRLKAVLKLTGSEAELAAPAVTKMLTKLGSSNGVDTTAQALTALGLDLNKLRNQDAAVSFNEIGAAIGRLPTAADQAASSLAILGKQGPALTNTFSALGKSENAAAGITSFADKVGYVVSELDRQVIGSMYDSLDKASFVIQGLGNQIAVSLAPVVTSIVERFNEWAASGTSMGEMVRRGIDVVVTGIEWIAHSIKPTVVAFYGLRTVINAVLTAASYGSLMVVKGLNLIGLATDSAVVGMEAMLDEMKRATVEAAGSFKTSVVTDYGNVVRDTYNDIQATAQSSAQAIAAGNKSSGKSMLAVTSDAAELEAKLMQSGKAIASNTDEAKILELQERGLSSVEADRLRTLLKQNEALKAQHDEQEKLRKQVEAMNAEATTPLAKYRKALAEIDKQEKAGLRYDVASEKRESARKEFQSAGEKFVGGKSPLDAYRDQLAEIDKAVADGTLSPAKQDRAKYEAYKKFSQASEGLVDSRPLDKFKSKLTELGIAFQDGTLTQEQYARGVEDTRKAFLGITTSPLDQYLDRIKALNEAVKAGITTQEQATDAKERARKAVAGETEQEKFRQSVKDNQRLVDAGVISKDEGSRRFKELYKGTEAGQLKEEAKTNEQRYLDRMNHLREAAASTDPTKHIDKTTYDRLAKKAREELQGESNIGTPGNFKFSGAMELGSAEARSSMLQDRFGKRSTAADKTAENTDEMKRQQNWILYYQRLTYENAVNSNVVTIS